MKVRVLMSADVTLQIETLSEDGFVEVRVIEDGGDNVAMLLSPIDALRVAEALKLGAAELGVPDRALDAQIGGARG